MTPEEIIKTIRAEIERRREFHEKATRACSGLNAIAMTHGGAEKVCIELLAYIDSLQAEHLIDGNKMMESSKDLEEVAEEYEKNHTYQRYDGGGFTPEYNATLAEAFIAGAEWGEKNAYKTIMKKADDVRDKMFDTDYEVKIEPAAGFDLGCVNVYHEGKLVGQYVEPKKEKKLPEGLDEAAEKLSTEWRKNPDGSESTEIFPQSFVRGFKAGAEWMAKQMPMPEDTVIFQKGVAEGKRLMMEDAVEAEVTTDNRGNIVVRAGVFNKGFEYGDKVRVIIVKEDEK